MQRAGPLVRRQATPLLRRALVHPEREWPGRLRVAQARRGLGSATPPPQGQEAKSGAPSSPPPPPPPPGGEEGEGKEEQKGEAEEPVSPEEAARLKKIAKIKEEIRRGYFYELGQLNKTGSKLFEADKEVVPIDKARPFPAFEAESLLGVTHRFETLLTQAPNQVSLVAVSFRDSGFRSLPDWIKPFQQEFGSQDPSIRVLQVNFEDKSWLRVLKFMMVNGQKASIERERHGQAFLRFGGTEEIREALGIDNRMVGYVFLVDGKGRARWRATGRPTEEEVGSMLRCAHELREEAAAGIDARGRKRYGKFDGRKGGR